MVYENLYRWRIPIAMKSLIIKDIIFTLYIPNLTENTNQNVHYFCLIITFERNTKK